MFPWRSPAGRGWAVAVVLAAAAPWSMAAEEPAAVATPPPTPAPAPVIPAPGAVPTSDPELLRILMLPTDRLVQLGEMIDRLAQMTPEQRRALAAEIREVERVKREILDSLQEETRKLSRRDRDVLRRYFATFRIEDGTAWRDRVRGTKRDEHEAILAEMLTAAAVRNITPNPELSAEPGTAEAGPRRGPGEGPRADGPRDGERTREAAPPKDGPAPFTPPTPKIRAPLPAAGQ